jgi:urease accessory protein
MGEETMLNRMVGLPSRTALLLLAGMSLAHAHHAMDYATPATLLDGLLSGLGHPVIGIDHLLFIVGAGVLASRFARGWLLPLAFAAASIAAVGMGHQGMAVGVSELWVAASLLVLAAFLFATRNPGRAVVAGLFLVAGLLHGAALAEAIVGAEPTPVAGYLAGLALVQCAVALAAWWVATRLTADRPGGLVQRLAGATIGVAGLAFVALATVGLA